MFDVKQEKLVEALGEELKDEIEMPEWAQFVKTGVNRERPPVEDDWWFVRAGSILRQVELKGPIGVSKLRYKYGGKEKDTGVEPGEFKKSSGKVVRTILQQLEDAGLVEKGQKGVHKGRVTTSDGQSFIFDTAEKLKGES